MSQLEAALHQSRYGEAKRETGFLCFFSLSVSFARMLSFIVKGAQLVCSLEAIPINKSASQCRDQYYLPEPLPRVLFTFMRALYLALWQVQLHAPQCPATYHFCVARLAWLIHDLRVAGSHRRLALWGELLLICVSAAIQHMSWGAPYHFLSCSVRIPPRTAMDR